MSEIRLERVEDWSTVKPGDPVRLTDGPTQINSVVYDNSKRGVVLQSIGEEFSKTDGWVMERPVIPEPLPTAEGAVIRVRLQGGRAAVLKLSIWRRWEAGSTESWSPEALWDELISWTWDTKPEALVVEETRRLILNDVLTVFDSSGYTGSLETDDLRNAVASAIAKAGT